jgi:hypothetical protein
MSSDLDIEFAQRISALETQVKALISIVEEQANTTKEILALKNKGLGVFMAASVVFGIILSLAGTTLKVFIKSLF